MTLQCPFCHVPEHRTLDANEWGLVVRDAFPVSPGHTLIIARRHVLSFFELQDDERAGLFELVSRARNDLVDYAPPDAFNIGINDGSAAGQTIPHLHIHLIPRYQGDRADPRGGVRWIFPEKADYWSLLRQR